MSRAKKLSSLDETLSKIGVDKSIAPKPSVGDKPNKMKSVPVRLTEEQWELVRELSFKTRIPLQTLIFQGLSMVFEEKGMKPLPQVADRRVRG